MANILAMIQFGGRDTTLSGAHGHTRTENRINRAKYQRYGRETKEGVSRGTVRVMIVLWIYWIYQINAHLINEPIRMGSANIEHVSSLSHSPVVVNMLDWGPT